MNITMKFSLLFFFCNETSDASPYSIGNMTALIALTEPNEVELIDYRQAYDDRGFAMVSSAAIALV